MIPVLAALVSIILTIAKIAALSWVFLKTRKWAAIAYLCYLLSNSLFLERLTSGTIERVQNNETMLWLGIVSGERVTNVLLLIRFVSSGIETALFIWLLLSLARRTQRI